MIELAIIGGSGLTELEGLEITNRQVLQTPYGEMSSPIIHGIYAGKSIVFLARHGVQHTIPPHKINYRANIWALKQIGVKNILAIAAVGSIHPEMQPGDLIIPHQIIDYTWGREHTFFTRDLSNVTHIDFTQPYCEKLRDLLLDSSQEVDFKVFSQGVYGTTQGPRLETAAEIDRMEQDGCDIVGMTGMPEAALARELELCYATCAIVANEAAGRGDGQISMEEIEENLTYGIDYARQLLMIVIQELDY
ncbi:MAG: S-methyl-5'-thioinosine phosphorylase [Proteobacteria bacterium]|nr:S-methyl-5'-thioinosine phosphorylase [Pseudomonadota bacterium]